MEISETALTGAEPEALYDLVADLANYPGWLTIVARAETQTGPERDPRGSWIVDLRGRVGPFARAKRLRMVRVVDQRPVLVRFERIEDPRRDHAPWSLQARVEPVAEGTRLSMDLHYGGSRFAPVLAPILREEIRRGRQELLRRFPLHPKT